jgi:hypothetical protein
MDRFICRHLGEIDDDLMVCSLFGVAYQRDMTVRAAYDESYFDKCAGYEGKDIAQKINVGRVELVDRFVGSAAVLDVGIGSGGFIKNRPNTFGYDINHRAQEWLKERGAWSDRFWEFSAFTFWDVLEHVAEPELYFRHIAMGAHLFCCLPIFNDLRRIRKSKHYRPGEHLYYFTEAGFLNWMQSHGFVKLAVEDFETRAGRESILSFAFRRELAS